MGKKKICNRLSRFGISAVLALGFLTACSNEEPEPEFTVIPPTPKSTQTEDPAEPDIEVDPAEEIAPPELPPEVFEDTVEGAESAARFYVSALNYGYAMLDTESLALISMPECETCELHIKTITQMDEKEQKQVGGTLDDGDTSETWETDTGVIFSFPITREGFSIENSAGEVIHSQEMEALKSETMVLFDGTMWRVRAAVHEVQVP